MSNGYHSVSMAEFLCWAALEILVLKFCIKKTIYSLCLTNTITIFNEHVSKRFQVQISKYRLFLVTSLKYCNLQYLILTFYKNLSVLD